MGILPRAHQRGRPGAALRAPTCCEETWPRRGVVLLPAKPPLSHPQPQMGARIGFTEADPARTGGGGVRHRPALLSHAQLVLGSRITARPP